MEQHTSPNEAEQQQLAALAPSASKRRCSSNTIDVCAEGARSSVSSESDAAVCWICLDGPRPDADLGRACACPRYTHAACLARWQLQSAGTKKEERCEFCDNQLPDWKTVLTPPTGAAAPAVMNVNFDGKTYSFEVKPGREGYVAFTDAIRRAFNLPEDSELNITFTCDEPAPAAVGGSSVPASPIVGAGGGAFGGGSGPTTSGSGNDAPVQPLSPVAPPPLPPLSAPAPPTPISPPPLAGGGGGGVPGSPVPSNGGNGNGNGNGVGGGGGSLLTLQGAGAYDAAVHCASVSAARRALQQQQQQQAQAAAAAAAQQAASSSLFASPPSPLPTPAFASSAAGAEAPATPVAQRSLFPQQQEGTAAGVASPPSPMALDDDEGLNCGNGNAARRGGSSDDDDAGGAGGPSSSSGGSKRRPPSSSLGRKLRSAIDHLLNTK